MSNPADCTIGDSVQVKKYTTWLNMNHCQYIKSNKNVKQKMSNPAYCTTGASVQVKKYNMVKYESLSVYQIKNVKSCWLYYRWPRSVQVKINNMVKYESLSVYQIKNVKSCWLYYRCLCTTTWLNMNHCQYIK